MSLERFFTGPTAITFPEFSGGWGGQGTALQLRKLFWSTASRTAVAMFYIGLNGQFDLDLNLADNYWGRAQLLKVWRDGTVLNLASAVKQPGFGVGQDAKAIKVVGTDDGRIARGLTNGNVFDEIIMQTRDPPQGLYACDGLWPNDVLTPGGRLAGVSLILPQMVGVLLPAQGAAYALNQNAGAGQFYVLRQPASAILFQVSHLGNAALSSWGHARDIFTVDASTTAITFERNVPSLLSGNPSSSAVIRVFTTNVTPWRLEWEDELPDLDNVAAYDSVNGIVYSTTRFPPSLLNASRLRRGAATISIPTTIGTTSQLRELTATDISVTVKDGLGSLLSAALVQWNLFSAVSSGKLVSQFSLTNNSGVATVTYTGPAAPSAAMTETVCATVATVTDG